MSEDELERYETEMELQLYKEYRDVLPMFSYVVETERRFYLANHVEVKREPDLVEVVLEDAWVWDMYRPARFVSTVRVITRRDVNVEELKKSEPELPGLAWAVGYNPLRRYRGGKAVDITIMLSSLLVIVALLIWAVK